MALNNGSRDYWIANLSLASAGKKAIEETLHDMPGLIELERRFASRKPLKGVRITGCVLVTYETANFVLLLKKLGADLRWCSDNRFASLDDACAYLASQGIPVFAKKGETENEFFWAMEQAIDFKDKRGQKSSPEIIIDDGCDITSHLHQKHPEIIDHILGVSEQTTCGVNTLYNLQRSGKLRCPAINVNESVTKSKFDNIYGARESLVEGLQRAINRQIGGKRVVIFGYGEVGKGCAQVMRGMGAEVIICEIDPIMAMQAIMNGLPVNSKQRACKIGDIFITATGCVKTISASDIRGMKDGAVLINMGHGNMEVDSKFLKSNPDLKREKINEYCDKYTFADGKAVYLLCDGYLLNLVAGQGHPPRVMSFTFTNHVLAILDLLNHPSRYKKGGIYKLSRKQDEEAALLNFPHLRERLTPITKEQALYLGIPNKGPYKRDDYRY